MFNSIKDRILLGLLILAIAGNVYFIIGKGVHITHNTISNSTSNSYANSGSLAVGYIGGDANGSWIIKEAHFDYFDDALKFCNTLTPVQYCFAKIVFNSKASMERRVIIIYPDITSDSKSKTQATTTTNGVARKVK